MIRLFPLSIKGGLGNRGGLLRNGFGNSFDRKRGKEVEAGRDFRIS
jgi:hypothetical protein